ncbi:phage tail domain-containing protein, partial [Staphylococcus ureilyticus]
MSKKKMVKIFDNNISTVVTDTVGLKFLDAEEEDVEISTNAQSIQGTDGEIPGPINFGPFNLKLRFSYVASDIKDYNLFKTKLRNLFYKREYYYLTHSDSPGKKYAVHCNSCEIERLTSTFCVYEVTFNVYKGYSESLHETDEFSLSNGNFQFESGVLPDSNTAYRFNRAMFEVLNGSSDTINPRHRHKLKIIIRMTTDEGFRLVNKTTGDIFEYKSDLDVNRQMTIDGGYPYIQQNDKRTRCGRLTNHGIITLDPGI